MGRYLDRGRGLFTARVVGPLGLLVVAGVLVSNRAATAGIATLPDGRYENVVVDGRVVPMIHVTNGGSVVLVDTDGKKPRTWEEQWKRKGDLPLGTYNVHKTDVNRNGLFADDPIDREGAFTVGAVTGIAGSAVLPDGRYENVVVEGRVVPMIHVMEGGDVVLVDTDGAKPRTWKEQFKRKGSIPRGTYDVHKIDANRNGTFGDDPVDRLGLWTIDGRGQITAQ